MIISVRRKKPFFFRRRSRLSETALGLAAALLLQYTAQTGLWRLPEAPAPLRDALMTMADARMAIGNGLNYAYVTLAGWSRIGSISRELDEVKRSADDWRDTALRLERENAALRRLAGVNALTPTATVGARMAMLSQAPLQGVAVIDRGKRDGIADNAVVSDEHGVIGRVVEVNERSARILSLNDSGSAVPVVNENGTLRGLLMGNGRSLPELRFLRDPEAAAPGERLLTSAGSNVPAGLPVGVVAGTSGGKVLVQLYTPAPAADGFVRVTQPLLNNS